MRLAIFVLFVILIPLNANSTTIEVPRDYVTIQAAIAVAQAGDTILVSAGTYYGCINFKGKSITVKSKHGPQNTILDGEKKNHVVVVIDGYAVLDGFTITNGDEYGGLNCYNGSPTIKNNIIINNTRGGNVGGGGITCETDGIAIIQNNIITKNSAGKNNGGGNRCKGNIATRGGAIACEHGSEPMIVLNDINNNTAKNGNGGGIHCFYSSPIIIQNTIKYNKASGGAGIDLTDNSSPLISNNIIAGNISGQNGGGIICSGGSEPLIINNTIVQNIANQFGGAIDGNNSVPTIINTIIWNNTAPVGPQISGTVTISYSNINGGWSGIGNIDADPLFVNYSGGDFHLSKISPCINMGINNLKIIEDIDGDLRPTMGTIDMGADEFVGIHTLESDSFTIVESIGGVIQLQVDCGIENAFSQYLILGALSGTSPGTIMPGGNATLPINWDYFTNIVLSNLNNAYFINFFAKLNANGQSKAVFDTNGPIQRMTGLNISFANMIKGEPWEFVSNPINIQIIK